ncbi:hypothetical protein LEP1GSC016_3424 [Leptospira borgpetersenii serovar Hardjo-bovis str. Sponselee]|uniref:Uncharacterized protein n=1 Tax=Leptospira borgpetersenii serovar Hardjo-bovis str. Sponselee TaxID=1303729 RepID=M6BR03_LEPBO|nr:hypothetical protein LEP1GSC016_3424 [Leptospira borgpetersenii serovar Hardjo-bovis str. Sponselee]
MNSLIPIENFKESYASILLILLKPILFHSIRIKLPLEFPDCNFQKRSLPKVSSA